MKKLFFFLTLAITANGNAQMATDTLPKAEVSTTMQSVNIDGNTIYLTAKAGTFQVRDENNEPIALMGHTFYTKDSKTRNNRRPILFAFNGGPGSSSFWLHMGVLGPKRIVVKDPDSTPAAPYKLVNNNQPAIVFAQETKIKSEPNLRSTEAFVLHEGTKVQVLDTVENWKKIKLSDGKTGWVMNDDIKLLKNF